MASIAAEPKIDFKAAARELMAHPRNDYERQVAAFAPFWAPNLDANVRRGYLQVRTYGRYRDVNEILRHTRNSIKRLPVTLFGAGPSAARELENISAGTTLLCVDRELGHLLEHGVRPRWVVSVDPRPAVAEFFKGLDTAGMELVCPVYTAPETIEAWRGRLWFYRHQDSKLSWFPGFLAAASGVRGWLYPGGNVSATALSLAYGVLWSPAVFMVGMDYSWKDRVYGDGRGEEWLEGKEIVDAVDVYGSPCRTLPIMAGYARGIEGMMDAVASECACRFYNCSGGLVRGRAVIAGLVEAYKIENIS